jgi:hypothetical protein
MLEVRNAIPAPRTLASGEVSTVRPRLLMIAVRIDETASRVGLAFCHAVQPARGEVSAV